ncbi:MAG: hypothetical protein ACREJC_07535 [Tepidisphaeraceae bacterium]
MRIVSLLILGTVTLLAGCERDEPLVATKTDELPAGLFLNQPPGQADDVIHVKRTAREGDSVVMRARVGGSKEPIAPARAIFTVTDLSLQTCDKSPTDSCPTPWDNCCDPTDVIADNSATIEVVNAGGRPLRLSLAGVGGLAPMKEIVVIGKVRGTVDARNLVIDAAGIYVKN